VTASFGVASFPEAIELDELVAAADSALYQAKRAGKNRVVVSVQSEYRKMV
jgi:diguanylate cyclase (GGDEF)-like protein